MSQDQVSGADAERILQRASEIETDQPGDLISVEDLREIASEAGYDPNTIDRAIAETLTPGASLELTDHVEKTGFLVNRLRATRRVPVDLTSSELQAAAELLAPYFESPPEVRLERGSLVWTDRRKLRFELTPSPGSVTLGVTTPRLVGDKSRWKAWVASSAARLEAMVLYVALRRRAASGAKDPA